MWYVPTLHYAIYIICIYIYISAYVRWLVTRGGQCDNCVSGAYAPLTHVVWWWTKDVIILWKITVPIS